MNRFRVIAFLAVVVLLAVGQVAEAGVRKSGLTGAAFLKIGVGARPVALGSSYTTVTGDVNQLFYNPAGITLADGKSQVVMAMRRENGLVAVRYALDNLAEKCADRVRKSVTDRIGKIDRGRTCIDHSFHDAAKEFIIRTNRIFNFKNGDTFII